MILDTFTLLVGVMDQRLFSSLNGKLPYTYHDTDYNLATSE
jgi:hypothetical protein